MNFWTREMRKGRGNSPSLPSDFLDLIPSPPFLFSLVKFLPIPALPLHTAVFLFSLLLTGSALADGGVVLAEKTSGPYRITLFGSPAPLRAGPADLSVLIQDAKTGEAVLNPKVDLQVQAASSDTGEAWVPPCCSMKYGARTVTATHDAAQNKLLYAATIVLPSSGSHKILVRLDDTDAFNAAVEISPALPPAAHYWSYLALPPLAIGFFALNQRLRRRPSPPRES